MSVVTSAVALFVIGGLASGVAPARADEQSYFNALRGAGIDEYVTPDLALQIGKWYCQQLGNGRSTQAAYSDLMDINTERHLLPPNGPVGTVIGAAIAQLCPQYRSRWNGVTDLEYIPVSQR